MPAKKFLSFTDFTAIDFETANAKYTSICQVGLVRMENGVITKEIELLVQPPDNQYHWGNSRVHGIKSKHTKNAPSFKEIWPEIEPYITHQHIVAHNAPFDAKCLRDTLHHFELEVPDFHQHCTVAIYKRNLKYLCDYYHIDINHHNALSDAKACAQLFQRYLNHKPIENLLF